MKYFYHLFLIITVVTVVTSCQNRQPKDVKIEIDNEIETEIPEKTVKKIFLNLPSPVELTQTVLKSDLPFNKNLLNPVINVDKYTTSGSLAFNFGIYGTDLCYCRIYDQLQEAISYLSVIRKITERLQIPEEDGAETINRIEEQIENRDSIFQIIADSYANADGYLKENERDMTATFILVGGWVEGLYIALNIANFDNTDVINRIAEQKYSINNLIQLLEQYKTDPIVEKIYPSFDEIKNIYNQINISTQSSSVVTDHESQITTIDNKSEITINKAQIDELKKLIGKIRAIIIS